MDQPQKERCVCLPFGHDPSPFLGDGLPFLGEVDAQDGYMFGEMTAVRVLVALLTLFIQ
jgi:hypothetical protein